MASAGLARHDEQQSDMYLDHHCMCADDEVFDLAVSNDVSSASASDLHHHHHHHMHEVMMMRLPMLQ